MTIYSAISNVRSCGQPSSTTHKPCTYSNPSPALAGFCVWFCSTRSMISPVSRGSRILCPIAAWSKCAKESAGKRYGTAGTKIGNAYLKWAFSAAAVLFLRNHPAGQKYLARLEKKHGKGKALTVLAHKLERAVYYMLKRDVVFDLDIFLNT